MAQREARRVPPTWQHPKTARGRYVPLFEGDVAFLQEEWDRQQALWDDGEHIDQLEGRGATDGCSYSDWAGPRPRDEDYMPRWTPAEATHYQMYEVTSEGTPISPVFETASALARWLVAHRVPYYAAHELGLRGWLKVIAAPTEAQLRGR